MADTHNLPPAIPPSTSGGATAVASKRAPRMRGLWISAALLSVAIVAAASWWFVGTRAWTNGQDVSIADREARLREVLWKSPVPLDDTFNTVDQEYEPTVSPDSTEIYFVRGKAGKEQTSQADIYVSYRRNNAWTKPAPVEGVNSEFDDLGPRLSSDGKYLFFYSNRPGGLGEYDIWASARAADGWGKPFNLGPSVNSEFNEYSPSPTPDGKRLIFSTNRKSASIEQKENWRATIRQNGVGDYDLFVADLDVDATAALVPTPTTQGVPVTQPVAAVVEKADVTAEAVTPAVNAETLAAPTTAPTTAPAPEAVALVFKPATEIVGINTPYHEGASCLSPFGDFLYFSSNRPGGEGKFDIYRARVQPDGSFGNVENLGKQINTAENETDPQLAMGGFHLLFSSDRPGSQGGYDLLSSDSVEVFSKRQGHPLPQLGWSWWVLLGSIIALIPLLLLLRGWNDHKLNVLQKCLLVSVMLHVLLTIGLSFVFVSQEVIHYARKELGMEVAVTLDVPAEQEIGMSIRSQAGSSDLPVGDGLAAPAPTQQASSGASQSSADLPDAFDVGVPGGQSAPSPGQMVVAVRAPQVTVPTPGHPVEVALTPVSPDAMGKAPAIDIKPSVRVSQNEVKVEAVTPNVEIARATGIGEKIAAAAEQVEVNVGRSDPAAQESIAQQAPTNSRPAAAMVAPEAVQSPAAPTAPQRTSVEVTGPAMKEFQKVASAGAEAPTAVEQAIEAARQSGGPTSDAGGVARPEGPSDTKVPTADVAPGSSLAESAAPAAGPRVQVAMGPAVKMNVDAPAAGTGPTITGPRSTNAPVSSAGPEAPNVAETAVGTVRQGAAGGVEAGGGGAVAMSDTKVPTADVAPKSSLAETSVGAAGPRVQLALGPTVKMNVDAPAAATGGGPTIIGPRNTIAPVASGLPDAPKVEETAIGTIRQGVTGGTPLAGGDGALEAAMAAGANKGLAPTQQGNDTSLAQALGATARVAAGTGKPAGPAVAVASPKGVTGGAAAVAISGPRNTNAPVASGLPDAPKVEEAAVGTMRQGVGGSTSAGRDSALEAAMAAGANKALTPTQQGNGTSLAQAPGASARVASSAGKTNGPAVTVASPKGVTDSTAGTAIGAAIKGSATKVSGADAGPMSPAEIASAGTVARVKTGGAVTGGNAGSAESTDLKVGASRPTTQPSAVADSGFAGVPGSRIGAIAPTAMVKPNVQPAIGGAGNGPKTDDLGAGLMATKIGKVGGGAGDAANPSVETSVASARVKGSQGGDIAGGLDASRISADAPAADGTTAGTGQSLAMASANAGPRKMTGIGTGGTTAAPNLTGGFAGPELAGPNMGASARAGKVKGPDVDVAGAAGGSREPGGSIVSKAGGGKGGTGLGATGPGGINIGADVVRPISPGGPGAGPIALGSSTGGVRVRGPAIDTIDGPKVAIAKPRLSAPEAMFQRSVEARKPVLEKMGGTQKSEEAVDRALSYLARNQEPDGRWTFVSGDGKPGNRGDGSPHDTANTGLALLAFLANDHTPVDPGPYRDVVAGGVKWLIKVQEPSGDLRGKQKGGGSDQGNMYDQGISTFALAEAALMTSDPEITAAAFRGADFIVKAQHNETGGWRYSPGESGDTSVFGWQVMALHSAELAGYKIPAECKAGMLKYIDICSQGQHKGLGGYQPGGGATPPMTAELLFCRIMLGQEINAAAEKEVGEFLTQRLAEVGSADFYCWYYTSLSLIQLQNDSWRKWNEKARDTLINMQVKGGANDGVWDTGLWRDRGGRVFNTALGALTLQVYYRYAPLRASEKDVAKP